MMIGILIGLIFVGFALGLAIGYGKGVASNADTVGEQRERIKDLAANIKALEFEVMALVGASPDADGAGRVLDILSGGGADTPAA